MNEDKTRLEWAQWMAAKNINVFAVSPNSKRPLEGLSWYLRQSTEPDTIAGFFKMTPNCNYGLHLGAEYVVVDLDVKPQHNGVKVFEDICRENGVDNFLKLGTLTVGTPGDGYHLYFKSPFPCANKNHFPDGIDVRGAHGFVVGPGSADSRGEWKLIDPDTEIAPLPEWLEEYVVRPGYKDPNRDNPVIDELDQDADMEYARQWLKSRKPAVQDANGDDWTFETACFVRDFGLSEAMALSVMLEDWNKRCAPPWDDYELQAKIANGYEYGQNRPGCKAPTYKAQRIAGGHGLDNLTPEQINEMAAGAADELAAAVDNVVQLRPGEQTAPDDSEDEDDAPLSAAALDAGDYPRALHQWQGYLLESHVNTLDGDGGMGKTQAMLQIAVAVAAGVPLFGADTRQRPGLLVLCEDDYGETKARLRAICDAVELRLADLPLDLWCRPGSDSTLAIIDDAGGLTSGPFLEPLTRRLASYGEPVFLGLDPISDIAVMDENKRLPQNTLAKRVLGGFARDFGATVLLNRHPSKASMSDGSFYSGATSGNNAYRNRLLLKWRDPDAKQGAMILEVVKSNYGLKGSAEIHHLNGVLDVLDKLTEAKRGELERGAVLDLIKRLLESGQTVVQDHGSGVKFRELSNMLRKEGFEMNRRDVEAYCRALAMAGRIHWQEAKGGKHHRRATWEIGPSPSEG